MRLKVLVPAKVIVDLEVDKVVAKSPDGYFCLLPHHVDFVSALAPGILTYEDEGGREVSLAIDEGTLAKCSREVLVATRFAIGRPAGADYLAAGAGGRTAGAGRPKAAGKQSRRTPSLPLDEAESRCRDIIAELENEFMKQLLGEDVDDRLAD
ncbi:MAG: F0F1 ATP synthase subunit epsilon [Thermoleophilia bacterium]